MAFLFVLKYVLSTCKTLFLESCTASTTMFSLLIPYLAPFFGIFHPGHQITGGNITYIHSTHTSHAGRDATRDRCHDESAISTYTPHAGRDANISDANISLNHFYSHAPCGARLATGLSVLWLWWFLLTRPMRGATKGYLNTRYCKIISTHTPHAGRDARERRAK